MSLFFVGMVLCSYMGALFHIEVTYCIEEPSFISSIMKPHKLQVYWARGLISNLLCTWELECSCNVSSKISLCSSLNHDMQDLTIARTELILNKLDLAGPPLEMGIYGYTEPVLNKIRVLIPIPSHHWSLLYVVSLKHGNCSTNKSLIVNIFLLSCLRCWFSILFWDRSCQTPGKHDGLSLVLTFGLELHKDYIYWSWIFIDTDSVQFSSSQLIMWKPPE